MLARLARELPRGDFLYEPKWDGFRCVAFREHEDVDLRSRHDRPLARYFPEIVQTLRGLPQPRLVLDGEVVLMTSEGMDFAALMNRLHPAASRVARLSEENPAQLVAFDLLACGDQDLRERPFAERRRALEALFETTRSDRLRLTPLTDDPTVANRWLERFQGGGIDGVIAKPRDLAYQAGVRAMTKVKLEHTADCVLAGLRLLADPGQVASLLLGLYDAHGNLEHIGVVTSFTRARRRELLEELRPLVVGIQGHPWEDGFLTGGAPLGRLAGAAGRWSPTEMAQDWLPLAPVRVCEVAYDQLDDHRLRHPARFRRWRPDRDPRSCTIDQLTIEAPDIASLEAVR